MTIRRFLLATVAGMMLCASPVAYGGSLAALPPKPADDKWPDVAPMSASAVKMVQANPDLQQAYRLIPTNAAMGTTFDWSRVNQTFQHLAVSGNPVAETVACALTLFHRSDDNHGIDEAVAITWCKRAADTGYGPAEYIFGILLRGYNDPAYLRRSLQWQDLARRQGVLNAATLMASSYTLGFGVPKDPATGATFISALISQDTVAGLYAQAVRYRRGIGVAADLDKSLVFLKQAAAKGNWQAQTEYAWAIWRSEDKLPPMQRMRESWWNRGLANMVTMIVTWDPVVAGGAQ